MEHLNGLTRSLLDFSGILDTHGPCKHTSRGNLFPSLTSPKSPVKAGLVELAPSTLPNLVQT